MNGIYQLPRWGVRFGSVALLTSLIIVAAWPQKLRAEETSAAKPKVIGDFALLDQNGRFHQLHRHADAKAVVIMTAGNGCPVVRQNFSKLAALRAKFPKVVFWMLNANGQDDVASILAETREFDVEIPILKDDSQMVAQSLGATRTAEVFAISTKDWTVFYHGALDDQIGARGGARPGERTRTLKTRWARFSPAKRLRRRQPCGWLPGSLRLERQFQRRPTLLMPRRLCPSSRPSVFRAIARATSARSPCPVTPRCAAFPIRSGRNCWPSACPLERRSALRRLCRGPRHLAAAGPNLGALD